MVIGAGDTSERTARTLLRQGARSILVANRTFERAAALATELGGEAVRWEEWEDRATNVDIMISSTSAPHYVLTQEKLEALFGDFLAHYNAHIAVHTRLYPGVLAALDAFAAAGRTGTSPPIR